MIRDTGLADTPLSILDLAFIKSGETATQAFQHTLDLARHAEQWGYKRFWLAEHHNIEGVTASATAVLVSYVAAGTSKIRVGAGGVMLPNHAPLIVAEQFGTLEALYPGRIDLGIGRAPGGDHTVTRALRRTLHGDLEEEFPDMLSELRGYLSPARPGQVVFAYPGVGTKIPLWLLGSTGYSASLAGALGLPFAFASHFMPGNLLPALAIYRDNFRPSNILKAPYAMAAIPVVAADTDEQANRLATTQQQAFLSLVRNNARFLKPPVDSLDWTEKEKALVDTKLRASIVGGPATIQQKMEELLEKTHVQELILITTTYEHADRLRSYEIVAEVAGCKQRAKPAPAYSVS